jgi:predicted dehydrogenase
VPDDRVGLGIIGCGHAALQIYGPGIAQLRDRANLVAVYDKECRHADLLAHELAARGVPRPRIAESLSSLLEDSSLSAVLNLTPGPVHHEVNLAALEAGKHVFSEKPFAGSLAEARKQIDLARRSGLTLLCAPAVMATPRFRWLKEKFDAGWIGRLTLATGQYANMGPAAWREFKGDPAIFYSAEVGPVLDTGVYILHAITGLFGRARWVEAFGGISIPRRSVLIPGRERQIVDVSAPDHLLIHLDFGDNRFAQILSSFATPHSKAPALEIHGEMGTVSIAEDIWYETNAPVDVWLRDERPIGVEHWTQVEPPPSSRMSHLVQAGLEHFIAVLNGVEAPILTTDHAAHVLQIALAATCSARMRRAVEIDNIADD